MPSHLHTLTRRLAVLSLAFAAFGLRGEPSTEAILRSIQPDLLLQDAALFAQSKNLDSASKAFETLLKDPQANPREKALAYAGLILLELDAGRLKEAQELWDSPPLRESLAEHPDLSALARQSLYASAQRDYAPNAPPITGAWTYATPQAHYLTCIESRIEDDQWNLTVATLSAQEARNVSIVASLASLKPHRIEASTWTDHGFEHSQQADTTSSSLMWHPLQVPFLARASAFTLNNLRGITVSDNTSAASLIEALQLQSPNDLTHFIYHSAEYVISPSKNIPFDHARWFTDILEFRPNPNIAQLGSAHLPAPDDSIAITLPAKQKDVFKALILKRDFSQKTHVTLHRERILTETRPREALQRHAERIAAKLGAERPSFRELDSTWQIKDNGASLSASRRYTHKLGRRLAVSTFHIVAGPSYWLEIDEISLTPEPEWATLQAPSWLERFTP